MMVVNVVCIAIVFAVAAVVIVSNVVIACSECRTNRELLRVQREWKEGAMETYSFGDWVVYDPGYKDPEIGRVTEDRGDSAFVCYHTGCTAASTNKRSLRRATEAEIQAAPCDIGFHRFDPWCPIAKECPGFVRCEALAKERER